MIKFRNVLLIALVSIVAVLFVSFAFFGSSSYDSAKAEEPTPQFTIGAGRMLLSADSSSFNIFNNGYSFVYFGTFTNNTNSSFTIRTPNLNFDTNLMSMSVNFSNSNVNNNLTILSVDILGYDSTNNVTRDFYYISDVNSTSLDSYFNDKIITIGASYEYIYFDVDVAVNSGYTEFAFNDFSIDFFSDFQLVYDDAFKDGYDTAKEEFYQSRYELGYSDGFDDGARASNQYSFFALISAVIETPINAVLGMLDFNFLDINLKSFFLSVFTIALIVMILRFVLAKN